MDFAGFLLYNKRKAYIFKVVFWMLQAKKAVIFDMDGTLIDSVGMWNDVDLALIRRLGGRLSDPAGLRDLRDRVLAECDMENPYLAWCAHLGRLCASTESPERIHDLRYEIAGQHQRENIRYRPGAAELVRRLKACGYTLLIASTTRRKNMDIYRRENKSIAAEADLDRHFDGIYTCEDVHNRKPHPEVYLRAMADHGLQPADCAVFEDALIGVTAARAAGIDVIAVAEPHSRGDREAIEALSLCYIEDFHDPRLKLSGEV